VAGRAKYIEPLLTALNQSLRDRQRDSIALDFPVHAGMEVVPRITTLRPSDSASDLWSHRAAIAKKGAASLGIKFGLILHILTTAI
jgi:hypothetical protein